MDTDPHILNIDNVNRFAYWHQEANLKYLSFTLSAPWNCVHVTVHIIGGLRGQGGVKMTTGMCFSADLESLH